MLPPYDQLCSGVDRTRPFWFYFTKHIRKADMEHHFMLQEEHGRCIVKYANREGCKRYSIYPGDEVVAINSEDVLGWSLVHIEAYVKATMNAQFVHSPFDITFRRWISVDQGHAWQTSPPKKTAGIAPSKEALEIWPRLQAEIQRGGGGGRGDAEEEGTLALSSATTATAAAASIGSASASVAPAGDASSLTSVTPGLKSPDPSDRYVVGTDGRVAGQPPIPRSGSTTPNSPSFNPSATTGLPTGRDGHNDYGHEDDLPIFEDDEVDTQDAGDDVNSKSESCDAKPPPRPSNFSVEPSLSGTAAAAANHIGILSNLPDIEAHGSAKPSASTKTLSSIAVAPPVVADVDNNLATPETTTIEATFTTDGDALSSSPIECLRDRVWEARRKQVEDAVNFLKDRSVHDAASLPDTIPKDHEAFLQHARAVKKALDRFKDCSDCPFVDTYKGKIKSLKPSQLQHFLYCIERNTRFAKTGGEASHGSIDETFLLPYILSRSEINEQEALHVLKMKSFDQSSDDSGYIDLRTWKCFARFVGGHSCSVSAMNSAVGMNCFQKSDLGPAGQDVSVHQMTHAMRDGKHCFPRETIRLVKIKGKNGAAKMRRILEHKGGMLLVHAVAQTPEKTKIGHFFAVNTDVKVILDCQSGKGRYISYSSVDPNDAKLVENFFRAFNVISVGKLYGVQVHVDRISQYFPHFIGAANGVFSGVQPQRPPDPLDVEPSNNLDASHAKNNKDEALISTVEMEDFDSKVRPPERNSHATTCSSTCSKRKATDEEVERNGAAARANQNPMPKKACTI